MDIYVYRLINKIIVFTISPIIYCTIRQYDKASISYSNWINMHTMNYALVLNK